MDRMTATRHLLSIEIFRGTMMKAEHGLDFLPLRSWSQTTPGNAVVSASPLLAHWSSLDEELSVVARLYCTRRSDGRAALVGEYVNGIDRDGNEGIHGHCEFSSGICHDARVTFHAFFDVETRCVQAFTFSVLESLFSQNPAPAAARRPLHEILRNTRFA
mmetsp:Transcript_20337/g.63967  ORF Transcript_20337/g.63967 Transcript_20337/m.63967 type:complete len:160 (-) Transcript_20337:134-613(-)